jgi:hypothetical protein
MDALRSSEISVNFYQTTPRHILEHPRRHYSSAFWFVKYCVDTGTAGRRLSKLISEKMVLSFLLPPLWSIGHPWNVLFHYSFLILKQSVGLHGWGISTSQGRYLYKHRQTSMPWMWFEPTIPKFERAKKVHALYLAATVTGKKMVRIT